MTIEIKKSIKYNSYLVTIKKIEKNRPTKTLFNTHTHTQEIYTKLKKEEKGDSPKIPWTTYWLWYWCSRTCSSLVQRRSTSPFSLGKCTVSSNCCRKIRISGHVCSVKRRRDCWRRRLPRMGPDLNQFPSITILEEILVFTSRSITTHSYFHSRN